LRLWIKAKPDGGVVGDLFRYLNFCNKISCDTMLVSQSLVFMIN
jgi:hypothetical protein